MPTLVLAKILDFTHAFFPKERFEEVREVNGWVFGKSGNGYIGIYSKNGYRWQTEGEYAEQELIAQGKKNIWITEVGRKETHGSFDDFVQAVSGAKLHFGGGLSVTYSSAYAGKISTGWRKPLTVNGVKTSIKNYKRYDNPTCQADWLDNTIRISDGEIFELKL